MAACVGTSGVCSLFTQTITLRGCSHTWGASHEATITILSALAFGQHLRTPTTALVNFQLRRNGRNTGGQHCDRNIGTTRTIRGRRAVLQRTSRRYSILSPLTQRSFSNRATSLAYSVRISLSDSEGVHDELVLPAACLPFL